MELFRRKILLQEVLWVHLYRYVFPDLYSTPKPWLPTHLTRLNFLSLVPVVVSFTTVNSPFLYPLGLLIVYIVLFYHLFSSPS